MPLPSRLSKTRVNRAGEFVASWFSPPVPEVGDAAIDELYDAIRAVNEWRGQHAYPMALVMPSLRNWVDRHSSLGLPPAQRLKRMPQIIIKLTRHRGMKLARMQDIGGCRAVLRDAGEVQAVADRITQQWSPRVADYRDVPRTTGYRALHLMVEKRDDRSGEGRTVEIQLRTLSQQRWAETVAGLGNRLGYALKDGEGPDELLDYFRMASDVLDDHDRDRQSDLDFTLRFGELREQVRPYFRDPPVAQ